MLVLLFVDINLWPELSNSSPFRIQGGQPEPDGRTDKQTEKQTNWQTDRQTLAFVIPNKNTNFESECIMQSVFHMDIIKYFFYYLSNLVVLLLPSPKFKYINPPNTPKLNIFNISRIFKASQTFYIFPLLKPFNGLISHHIKKKTHL